MKYLVNSQLYKPGTRVQFNDVSSEQGLLWYKQACDKNVKAAPSQT